MGKRIKALLGLAVLSLSICIFGACGQNAASPEGGGYTLNNIRDQIVGIDEEMELANGAKTALSSMRKWMTRGA